MISIMYHYIFNRNTNNLNGIYPMWDDEFRYQLNWLKNNYSIIDPYAFINNIEEEKYFSQKTKKPKCLLTFDDGTKDQIQIASKILDEYNHKAIFFMLTDVITKQILPLSHLLHMFCVIMMQKKL